MAPDDIESADRALVQTGFKLITDDRLQMALEIHRFANDVIKNVASDRHKRLLLVNYANCYNLLNNHQEADRILSRMDRSAADLDFQICVSAVRGDVDKVVTLMRRAASANILTAEDFRTWPVFRNIQKQDKFRDEYKTAFGKELIPGTSSAKIDLMTLKNFVSGWLENERMSPERFGEIVSINRGESGA
jgi:hypothetical protein